MYPYLQAQVFYPKVVERSLFGGTRIYVQTPAVPFAQLHAEALLDTHDLMRLFDCSPATLYRCIYERELKPTTRAGRVMLFAKRDVLRWLRARQKPGR